MWYNVRLNDGMEAKLLNNAQMDDGPQKCSLGSEAICVIAGIIICNLLKLGRVYSIFLLIFCAGIGMFIAEKIAKSMGGITVRDLINERFFCARTVPAELLGTMIAKDDELKKFQISAQNDRLFLKKNTVTYIVFFDSPHTFLIDRDPSDKDIIINQVVEDYGKIAYSIQKAIQIVEYYPPKSGTYNPRFTDFLFAIIRIAMVFGVIWTVLVSGKKQDYTNIVREGNFDDYPGVYKKIDTVLSEKCTDITWDQYTEEGDIYVSFSGRCRLTEESKSVRIKLIFLIENVDAKKKGFQLEEAYIDGEELSLYECNLLIMLLFEDDPESITYDDLFSANTETNSKVDTSSSKAEKKKDQSVANTNNDRNATPTPLPELDIVEGGVEDYVGSYTGYKGEDIRGVYITKEGANTYVLHDKPYYVDYEDYMYYGRYDSTKKAVFFYKYELRESGWDDYGNYKDSITRRGECSGYMYTYGDGTVYVVYDKEKYNPNHNISMVCYREYY